MQHHKIAITSFIIIIGLFIFTQPRLQNYIFPVLRNNYFNNFIKNTNENGKLDSQKFWETREFYYPGYMQVFQDGLTVTDIAYFKEKTGFNVPFPNSFSILVYRSPKWLSYEALLNSNKISDMFTIPDGTNFLYKDNQSLIYSRGGHTYIIFIKSYDDLKKTNGFIYREENILKNYQYWLSISEVTE